MLSFRRLLLSGVAVALFCVAAGCSADGTRESGRDPTVAVPSPERVAAALRFGALAELPDGAIVGPLRAEDGIDSLVAFRVRMAPIRVGRWLAASGLPAPVASPVPVTTLLGPPLPAGTPEIPQHRAGRADGGVVVREGAVVADGVLEIRAFET